MKQAVAKKLQEIPVEGDCKTPVPPTAEQADHFALEPILEKNRNGRNVEIGKHWRRKRVLEALYEQRLFIVDEYKALAHYRHHADIADKSPLRDSILTLGRISTGSGDGPTHTTLNAIRVRDDCEKAAGWRVDILRAVIVDDTSLSQWCIDQGQSVEKCRTKRGCKIEATPKALAIARDDIQKVAKLVMAHLDA